MEKAKTKKEESPERKRSQKQEVSGTPCSFAWETLLDMKDKNIEFFAGDGYKRLRIIDIDKKTRNIHFICELGKITWPLNYNKLEEIHKKIHDGEVALIPYEVDKLIPTWGNFVTGLFKYFGCESKDLGTG